MRGDGAERGGGRTAADPLGLADREAVGVLFELEKLDEKGRGEARRRHDDGSFRFFLRSDDQSDDGW
jgi:hypothetical protein